MFDSFSTSSAHQTAGPQPAGYTPAHSNLYISNLPLDFDQHVVETMFKVHGTIVGSKFVRMGPTPYAFIKLGSPEEAAAALGALNGSFINGRQIVVKFADKDINQENQHAQPHDNLYIKQVPLAWTDEDVRNYFQNYGPVTSVRMLFPLSGASSQGAMVRYSSVDDAARAKDGSHMQTPPGATMPLLVRFADTPDDKARKGMRAQGLGMGMSMGRGGPGPGRFAPYPGAGASPGMYGDMGPGTMGGMQDPWNASPGYGAGGPMRGPRPYGEPGYGAAPGAMGVPAAAYRQYSQPSMAGYGSAPPYQPPMQAPQQTVPAQQQAAAYTPSTIVLSSPPVLTAPAAFEGPHNITIRHLPINVDKLWLYENFARFGGTMAVTLHAGGTATILYSDSASARKASETMNNARLGDGYIGVELGP